MELIRELHCVMGVYFIEHLPSGKFYVGSGKDCLSRIDHHFNRLRVGSHNNPAFQELYNRDSNEYHYLTYFDPVWTREEAYDKEQEILNRNRDGGLLLNRTFDARCPIRGIEDQETIATKRREGQRRYFSDKANRNLYSERARTAWKEPGRREKRSGSGNPFARRVEINSVVYGSVKEAETALGISEKTIRKRANSPDHPNYGWPDGDRVHHKQLLESAEDDGLYARKIVVDGVVYPTMKLAMKATKASWSYLMKQANDPTVQNVSVENSDLTAGRPISYTELITLAQR